MKKILVYGLAAMVIALSYSFSSSTHDRYLDHATALKVDMAFSILMSLAGLFLVLFPSRLIVGLLAASAFASSYAFNTTLPAAPLIGICLFLVLLLMGLTDLLQRMKGSVASAPGPAAIFPMAGVCPSSESELPAKPTH